MNTHDILDTFRGKKVFITGHTGFKGSWLSFILNEIGANIFGFSIDKPEDVRHAYYALNIDSFLNNLDNAMGDVRDYEHLARSISKVKPDFLFHLAAQPIVSTSYVDPFKTFSTNVNGTLNVLEFLRQDDSELTGIIITSDKCYKNKEQMVPYVESDEMGGDDPYSASKGAAELIIHSYLTSFPKILKSKGTVSVRAGNVFGGGDWSKNRLIPDCVRDIFQKGEVEIRMPEAVRPWTYILDILFGYLMLAAKIKKNPCYFSGSWNFASGETRTVREIVQAFINSLGTGKLCLNPLNNIGKESALLLIDPTKANKKLNWSCKMNLDDSIKVTADWYQSQKNGLNMVDYSRSLLAKYYLNNN